jgi:sugar transferase EpsL
MSPRRFIDVAMALVALMVALPVMAVVAVMVRCVLGRPVLFRQQRPGLHGQPFTILKFRTMRDHRGPDGQLLPDGERLGRFGRFLRSSSLDELPELINVLRGEMSIVGPRPLMMSYLPLYTAQQARRHEVRPGITGLAQVSGRNAVTWEDRFALDVQYVETRSFMLDLRIMAKTLVQVARRDGISTTGYATGPAFVGTADQGTADRD